MKMVRRIKLIGVAMLALATVSGEKNEGIELTYTSASGTGFAASCRLSVPTDSTSLSPTHRFAFSSRRSP